MPSQDYIIVMIRSKTLQKVQKQISDIFGTFLAPKKYLENLFLKKFEHSKNGCEEFLFLYMYYNSSFRFNSSGRKCHRDPSRLK